MGQRLTCTAHDRTVVAKVGDEFQWAQAHDPSRKTYETTPALSRGFCLYARSRQSACATFDTDGGKTYAVFFDVMLYKKRGPNTALLTVESAYELYENKRDTRDGRINFNVLLWLRSAGHETETTATCTLEKQKPHFLSGAIVSPVPLTLRRAGPLARRASTAPAFVLLVVDAMSR
jgi:hypothetical protein